MSTHFPRSATYVHQMVPIDAGQPESEATGAYRYNYPLMGCRIEQRAGQQFLLAQVRTTAIASWRSSRRLPSSSRNDSWTLFLEVSSLGTYKEESQKRISSKKTEWHEKKFDDKLLAEQSHPQSYSTAASFWTCPPNKFVISLYNALGEHVQ